MILLRYKVRLTQVLLSSWALVAAFALFLFVALLLVMIDAAISGEVESLRSETAKHFTMDGRVFVAECYSGPIHYKEDYGSKAEPWKDIDPSHVVETVDTIIYDRMPFVVKIWKDRTGYEIIDRKTGAIRAVELVAVNDAATTKLTDKVKARFEVFSTGVRLWKDIEAGGPQKYKWKISAKGSSVLKFRDLPEAFDEDGKAVEVATEKISIDDDEESFYWIENVNTSKAISVDTDYIGDAADGYVLGSSGTYATARSTSANFSNNSVASALGQVTGYTIYRAFFLFDTSSIPDESTISDVKLNLAVYSNTSTTDFDVQVVEQDWSAQNPLATGTREAAYDNCLAGSTAVVWKNTADIAALSRYAGPSMTNAYVSKTGFTYYSLRSSRDYANTSPSDAEWIELATMEDDAARQPKLEVTYTAGSSWTPQVIIIE